MKNLKMFVSLFIFWMALSDGYTLRSVLSGLVASFFTLFIYRWLLSHAKMEYPKGITLGQLLKYTVAVFIEIFKAAFDQIHRIFFEGGETEIISIHLEANSELVAALIANAITLTPGSVTVELNQKQLKVLMYKDDPKSGHVNKTHDYVLRLQKIFR